MTTEQGLRNVVWNEETLQKYGATYKDGKPYVNDKQVVLSDEVQDILKKSYRLVPTNTGILRFMSWINKRYYGIHRNEAFHFLKDQSGYQKYQALHTPSHSNSQIIRAGPGAKVQIDHKAWQTSAPPQGNFKGALFVIDLYSRKLWVYPHRGDESARTNRLALEQFFNDIGGDAYLPRVLQMDNGPAFQGECRQYIEARGIRIVNSDPRHPASQGQVERVINTISRFVTSTADSKYGSPRQWPRALPEVVEYYNTTRHRVLLNKTPNEVWEAGQPEAQLTDRMVNAALKTRNSRIYDRVLRPGDKVLLSKRISANTSALVKQQIVSGIRKKYLDNWDTTQVYTIEKRYGANYYYLVEAAGRYDRVDLLKIPTDNPKAYPAEN
jgi:hypothetical protein